MSEYGYPCPGPQAVSVDEIMTKLYFMTQEEWKTDSVSEAFDYVVIGSSFCCLSFVQQILKNAPNAKIIIMDRGTYFHPEHFQNLPPAYALTVGGQSETFHWKITERTHNGQYIKYQHGMNNFFGGRSSFWSAWCPEPTNQDMEGWPAEVKQKVHDYFDAAKNLLNVVPANEISSKERGDAIFGTLQKAVYDRLHPSIEVLPSVYRVEHAPLAVRADMYRFEDYNKFSASGPILNLLIKEAKQQEANKSLKCVLECCVEKIIYDQTEPSKATSLQTSKGEFKLGKAKLILAMGTLPPTTLMLNSFPSSSFPRLSKIGTRFTAHFISSIIARVPINPPNQVSNQFMNAYSADPVMNIYSAILRENMGKLQMAAVYVAGTDPSTRKQFHIQLTAVIDETPAENIYDTMRHLPDVVAAPSPKQLSTSKGYVVFVCACLGELDHVNAENWYKLDGGSKEDVTCNTVLQALANENDNACWSVMDNTTFTLLEDYLTPGEDNSLIEYWSPNKDDWNGNNRPSPEERRVPGLVHEASTMWIGDDSDTDAPVDLDYKFHGVDNVYLTGGALWPTGGSWNPTCAMSALAMDLADKLSKQC